MLLSEIISSSTKFSNSINLILMKEINEYFPDELDIDYTHITKNIYLGNGSTSHCLKTLKNLNITHILICAIDFYEVFPNDFAYWKIPLRDDNNEDISLYFEETNKFIDKSECIYIHCQAGISRSPAILISYLMCKNSMTFAEAFQFVKLKRSCIRLKNSNYVKLLNEYEKSLIINKKSNKNLV